MLIITQENETVENTSIKQAVIAPKIRSMHITSRDNTQVKRVCALQRDAGMRQQAGMYVCEGLTLLAQAEPALVREVFCTEEMRDRLPAILTCPIYTVTDSVMQKLSDTKTPQGVLFLYSIELQKPPHKNGRWIVLSDLRDPGNMGTIIRTAEGLSMDGIILLPGCADCYSPKVVRAAMGSLFRIKALHMEVQRLREVAADCGAQLAAAALEPDAQPIFTADLNGSWIVIGNEAHGLSPEVRQLCSRAVVIPVTGAQSLNAAMAAGIFMYELCRREYM